MSYVLICYMASCFRQIVFIVTSKEIASNTYISWVSELTIIYYEQNCLWEVFTFCTIFLLILKLKKSHIQLPNEHIIYWFYYIKVISLCNCVRVCRERENSPVKGEVKICRKWGMWWENAVMDGLIWCHMNPFRNYQHKFWELCSSQLTGLEMPDEFIPPKYMVMWHCILLCSNQA